MAKTNIPLTSELSETLSNLFQGRSAARISEQLDFLVMHALGEGDNTVNSDDYWMIMQLKKLVGQMEIVVK
jgi:hypothetical protein